MSKINYQELKRMLTEGKTEKEIALHFNATVGYVRHIIKTKLNNAVVTKSVPNIADVKITAVEHTAPEVVPTFDKVEDSFNCSMFVPQDNNEKYISRDIDKNIRFWADNHKTCLLVGESGSGKTYSIWNYAREYKLPLLIIPCDDSQVLRELLGYWQAVNQSTVWQEGLLSQMLKRPCVVLFDEVNSLPPARLFMLHELIQNRRLFVKDAPAESAIINVHAEARLMFAMNPAGSSYSGANRLNCALANRLPVIEVKPFDTSKLVIDSGNDSINNMIRKFYQESQRVIKEQRLRVVVSKRNIDRIANAIKSGLSVSNAVREGFINSAMTTATESEKNALLNIARVVFGPTTIDTPESVDLSEVK